MLQVLLFYLLSWVLSIDNCLLDCFRNWIFDYWSAEYSRQFKQYFPMDYIAWMWIVGFVFCVSVDLVTSSWLKLLLPQELSMWLEIMENKLWKYMYIEKLLKVVFFDVPCQLWIWISIACLVCPIVPFYLFSTLYFHLLFHLPVSMCTLVLYTTVLSLMLKMLCYSDFQNVKNC